MDVKKKILFVCTANRYRSRTAYDLFKSNKNINVDSCGLNKFYVNDTIKYVWSSAKHFSKELLLWADLVYVMEKHHYEDIERRNKDGNWGYDMSNVINLDIEDIYEYNNLELINILKQKINNI